jgi:hypothetical protein
LRKQFLNFKLVLPEKQSVVLENLPLEKPLVTPTIPKTLKDFLS